MKKAGIFLTFLVMLLALSYARAEEVCPPREYTLKGVVSYEYESDSLQIRTWRFTLAGEKCYLSHIWMTDPSRQIRKVTADWKTNIRKPTEMAEQIPEAALIINGSGYVSPQFPWIPENYPGTNEDYYYTPLGSLTVTDGEIFRDLDGIPYTGLTLEADGLHLYIREENEKVLSRGILQTWSFYEECPMQLGNEDILPEDWKFADRHAQRTVIARVDRNNYLVMTVSREKQIGLTLRQVNEFLRTRFETEWVYDLDGGDSSALLVRKKGKSKLIRLMGGYAKDADIMAFTELPENE